MKESGEKQQSDEIQAVGKKRAWGHHTVLISFHTLRHFAHRLGPLSTNPVAPQYVAQQIQVIFSLRTFHCNDLYQKKIKSSITSLSHIYVLIIRVNIFQISTRGNVFYRQNRFVDFTFCGAWSKPFKMNIHLLL